MYNDKGFPGNVFVHGVYAEVNIYETFLNTEFSAEFVPRNIRFTIFFYLIKYRYKKSLWFMVQPYTETKCVWKPDLIVMFEVINTN